MGGWVTWVIPHVTELAELYDNEAALCHRTFMLILTPLALFPKIGLRARAARSNIRCATLPCVARDR